MPCHSHSTEHRELSYAELEARNLENALLADQQPPETCADIHMADLRESTHIKAVTLCFTDLEGRLHMLDYDKKFLLSSYDNLTFDGSSIRGFTVQRESDLRLEVDWGSIRYVPTKLFGAGKVLMFASVLGRDRTPYCSDFRSQLKLYAAALRAREGITAYAAPEIEGFLVDGIASEQNFSADKGFAPVSSGGYYHSLPQDPLRVFIDASADVQRAMGFQNEKDHPEVAPSQFEMNFSYADAVRAADNIQLYKLICRQVARTMGYTATFLPKPFTDINGSGMHTNFSLSKGGVNLFYDAKGREGLSELAWQVIARLLEHAPAYCLIMNSSVNSYRRLDPHYEAPNEIMVSPVDRGSMIRIPVGNAKSARIELRSVAPDANPYLLLYTMLRVGLEGPPVPLRSDKRHLSHNIHDAIALMRRSAYMTELLGEENAAKFIAFKEAAADRSPKLLGKRIKSGEVLLHHEITNQFLWNDF